MPTPGSEAAQKIIKILKRLEDFADELNRKKDDFGHLNLDSGDKDLANAQVRCINQIIKLKSQAVEVWNYFCKKCNT
jgi:hypothetical protein